ncbi:gas vesicle protein, partial [Streptomyces montanus]
MTNTTDTTDAMDAVGTTRTTGTTGTTGTDIVYAYAVLRRTSEAAEAVAGLRGVAGERIRLLGSADPSSELAAAVGPVPAADFDEQPLKAHLEDLRWLESTARAHHAVVAALAGLGATVLPLRLATVYLDEDRVRQTLDDRRDDFLPLLDRLTGHVELGVKVYAAPDAASPDPRPGPDPAAAPAADLNPGRAYLAGRRRMRRTAEDAWQAA